MKKTIKTGKIILGVAALTICSYAGMMKPNDVYAKSSKIKLEKLFEDSDKETVGNYTFELKNNTIKVKGNKDKKFTKIKKGINDLFTNGKTVYFTKGNAVCKMNLKTKKIKKVIKVKLSKKGVSPFKEYISLDAISGKNLYIGKYACSNNKQKTLVYNTKSKKLKDTKQGAIIDIVGKTAFVSKEYLTGADSRQIDVVKMTKKGLKKVKTLSKTAWSIKVVNGKFYYVEYENANDFKKGIVCRCDKNGKVEKLVKIKDTTEVYVLSETLTDEYCDVNAYDSHESYRIYYADGRKVKLEN